LSSNDCKSVLIASSVFIYFSVNSALPYNRLANIIGENAAGKVKLEELHTGDSFNDGEWAYGIMNGNMNLITEYRVLKHEISVPRPNFIFEDYKLPETGDIYSDSHGYFYVSPENNKIYFYWHSRINKTN